LGYKHLDYRKRCQIYGLWKAGYTQSEIARDVGIAQSTVSRELNRNITFIRTKLGSWQYKPDYAQGYAKQCHKDKKKKLKLTSDVAAYHEKISKELNIDFYFAHPYSSWERGLNENTNGLVRQYLKKGSNFTEITDKKLEVITDYLNNRPRKSLGYSTPNEIFNSG
jgi:IS30 family transposase